MMNFKISPLTNHIPAIRGSFFGCGHAAFVRSAEAVSALVFAEIGAIRGSNVGGDGSARGG